MPGTSEPLRCAGSDRTADAVDQGHERGEIATTGKPSRSEGWRLLGRLEPSTRIVCAGIVDKPHGATEAPERATITAFVLVVIAAAGTTSRFGISVRDRHVDSEAF